MLSHWMASVVKSINLSERLDVCPFVFASLTYFGKVLLCPHKHIVTDESVHRIKQHTRGNISDFYDILKFQLEKFFRDKCAHCYS